MLFTTDDINSSVLCSHANDMPWRDSGQLKYGWHDWQALPFCPVPSALLETIRLQS